MNIYGGDHTFWEQSINTRRSVRSSYLRDRLNSDDMKALQQFCKALEAPFDHDIEIRFFKSEGGRMLANNLRKPPEDCVAFIAGTDLLSVAKVGFIGELVLLYATGLGISTCWFGHYLKSEVERLLPDLAYGSATVKFGYGAKEVDGRRAVCISPLGYEADRIRMLDRMTTKMNSFKRKPLDERLTGGMTEERLTAELRFALDLARKAPSAANTQHWEFAVAPDQKSVTIAKPLGYKHKFWEHPDVCVGCCAAHFWLGLAVQGIDCAVAVEEADDRVLWRFSLSGGEHGA